jgi:hypothetical protein
MFAVCHNSTDNILIALALLFPVYMRLSCAIMRVRSNSVVDNVVL